MATLTTVELFDLKERANKKRANSRAKLKQMLKTIQTKKATDLRDPQITKLCNEYKQQRFQVHIDDAEYGHAYAVYIKDTLDTADPTYEDQKVEVRTSKLLLDVRTLLADDPPPDATLDAALGWMRDLRALADRASALRAEYIFTKDSDGPTDHEVYYDQLDHALAYVTNDTYQFVTIRSLGRAAADAFVHSRLDRGLNGDNEQCK